MKINIGTLDFSPIDSSEVLFEFNGRTYYIVLPNFDSEDYENYVLPRRLPVYDKSTHKLIEYVTLDDELYEYIHECIVENLEDDDDDDE